MNALFVLATVDKFLQKVYGPKEKPRVPMVACSGLDQRLDLLIDEVRGLRAATENLVALQAENLRLKVAGPSGANTMDLLPAIAPAPLLGQVEGAADIVAGVRELVTDECGDVDEADQAAAIANAAEHGDAAELRESMAGRIGKAIKRKVEG